MHTRPAALAGLFYPENPEELRRAIRAYVDDVPKRDLDHAKVLIAPHAGYVYSGPTAGHAYALVTPKIERVVLLGPAHRVAVHGLVAPRADAFATPLGTIPIDHDAIDAVAALPQVSLDDRPHAQEHSLEVHLPFLQERAGTFGLVPFVVGHTDPESVAEVLERLWGGPETLIVISTDLSHFHDYDTARRLDATTTQAIEQLAPESFHDDSACGRFPLAGLLVLAKRRGMQVHTLDVRNSADTAGTPERVVGYGAYALR